MNTADVAIICESSVAVLLIGAAWSLAWFKGWRIITPSGSPPKPKKTAAAEPAADASTAPPVSIESKKAAA